MTQLQRFGEDLKTTSVADLRDGLIGRDLSFETPFGTRKLLYADFVASGRALKQVEAFVTEQVLPYYANSHTEASHCGMTMTRMREEARKVIGDLTGADDTCSVVFTGSGATAGINRIVGLLDIANRVRFGANVVVFIGPYEHHSNILPWRESGAKVIEIPEAQEGGPDLTVLAEQLRTHSSSDLLVGSFSAASNVTGIVTDPDPVTRTLKHFGALAIWDYAGGAPYLPMHMSVGNATKDAIVFSAHKFPGGPGASGVAVIRETVVRRSTPTAPGGGTVTFVSPQRHAYSGRVEVREEAGTPNVIGDIRAALALMVKERVGCDWIAARDEELRQRALSVWAAHPNLQLLGQVEGASALPIFSFRVHDSAGGFVHHQLFTRMLSDMYGIQARGGCACAGPYAHRLLNLSDRASTELFRRLEQGHETEKPGWVRLNLSYLHDDDEATRIIEGVADLASHAEERAESYTVDSRTARFRSAAAG